VVLCLAAAGAAQLGSEPLLATVPRELQTMAWMAFGGVFALGMYTIVRLTNERVISIDRALGRLLLGVDQPSSLSSAATLFALGVVASMQAGPGGAS